MQSRSLLIKVQSDKRCRFDIAKSCITNTPFIINIYCGIIFVVGGQCMWFIKILLVHSIRYMISWGTGLWHHNVKWLITLLNIHVEKVNPWNPQSLVILEQWFFHINSLFYFLSKTWEHLDVIFDIHCMLMTVNLLLNIINIYLCVTVKKD